MEEIYPHMLAAAIFTINKIQKQPKCLCVCVCMCMSLLVLSLSLRPYVPTRFLVHGILQARILEWVAI